METKQLTQEELQEIKTLRDNFTNNYINIGMITDRIGELEKEREKNISSITQLKQSETIIYQKLKEKYGEGTVDLTTGEFKSEN